MGIGIPAAHGDDWLVREVQRLSRDLNEQRAANPYAPMGIIPRAGGLDVTGFIHSLRTADGSLSLSMDSEADAFIAYDATGAAMCRIGKMKYANPGVYGVEIFYNGAWVQVGAGNVDWGNISNRPTAFTPAAHTHPGADVTSAVADATGSSWGYNNNVGGTSWVAAWIGNDAGNKFGRNTSSIRYKQNAREHWTDPANVLAIKPVMYERIGSGVTEFGLIAEQVAEHFPELVTWFDGKIDSVRYDLLAVALLSVVRHQDARLDALEAAVAQLKPGYTPPSPSPVAPQSTACNNPPVPQPAPDPYTIAPQA